MLESPRLDVRMDFIVSLSQIQQNKDFVMEIMDRFSNIAYFILVHKMINASHSVDLYFREVVRLYRMSGTIKKGVSGEIERETKKEES